MCGLVALISKRSNGMFQQDQTIFKELLYADAVRGWDATGVFGVNKHGNVDIKKSAVPAGAFLQSNSYTAFNNKVLTDYHFVVGHNRKATHGQKISENSHPFWSENEEIVLVHNGMVSNHDKLDKGHQVDSKALCEAISKSNDILKTLSEVEGAYAIIWYNVPEKALYFCRNEQRPLTLTETDGTLVLSSEAELATWIIKRNKGNISKQLHIPADKVFKVIMGKNELITVGEIEKKSRIYQTTTTYRGGPTAIIPAIRQSGAQQTSGGTTNAYPANVVLGEEDVTIHAFTSQKDLVDDLNSNFNLFPPKSRVFFRLKDYSEIPDRDTGEIRCEIRGEPINIEPGKFVLRMLISKDQFDSLDFSRIHSGEVTLKTIGNNSIVSMRVCKLAEHYYVTSKNGTIVPDDLWYSDLFPESCTLCKTKISFKALTQSQVVFAQKHKMSVMCPECRKHYLKD